MTAVRSKRDARGDLPLNDPKALMSCRSDAIFRAGAEKLSATHSGRFRKLVSSKTSILTRDVRVPAADCSQLFSRLLNSSSLGVSITN